MEFRKHNMANLFIQMKDVRTYKDKSDVNQWTTEFPLKLQVVKQFETEIDSATPKYGGAVPIEGEAPKTLKVSDEGRREVKINRKSSALGFIRRIFKRLWHLPNGISQENTPTRANSPKEGITSTGEQNGNQ
jgi:hypothetical protein